MDTAIFVAIIINAAALISLISTNYLTKNENNKAHYIEVITKQTMTNMVHLRECVIKFSTLVNPEVIIEIRNNESTSYIKDLLV